MSAGARQQCDLARRFLRSAQEALDEGRVRDAISDGRLADHHAGEAMAAAIGDEDLFEEARGIADATTVLWRDIDRAVDGLDRATERSGEG